MSQEFNSSQQTRLIPLTEWSKYHAYPPLGGLRHLVFHAKTNNFDKVIKRINRRILIDERAFFAWVESKNPQVKEVCHE